jgi:hypothetical protein
MASPLARWILRWRRSSIWLPLLVFPLLVAAILLALPAGGQGPLGPAGWCSWRLGLPPGL